MNQQLPAFSESLPINPLLAAASYFSLDCLQMSFELLRDQHPGLALVVQNCMADARHEYSHNHQDKHIALQMDLQQVSDIVTALSVIAETAAREHSEGKTYLASIHQTLLDWLLYAQSFLVEVQGSPE